MIKQSVKKPFTVLVAVVMIIALGLVSLTSMTADLLPDFSLPYMIVITTYPGAGPEKVEAAISKPMESALGTISGVKTITSNSADNYSTVQLEFNDGTDMSAALVKVSNALDAVKPYLPEEAGTPTIMEVSMDMMASVYLGVSYEGKDDFELSQFVDNDLVPYLERQEGVANINTVGLVSQSIVIELDEEKVQDLNDRILGAANKAFGDAYKQLADAKQQLIDGQADIDDGYVQLEDGREELAQGWKDYYKGLGDIDSAISDMDDLIDETEKAAFLLPQLMENKDKLIDGMYEGVNARGLVNTMDTQASTLAQQIYGLSLASGDAINAAISNAADVKVTSSSLLLSSLGTQMTVYTSNAAAQFDASSKSAIETYTSQMAVALGSINYIASEAGIYSPASIQYTMTVGQVVNAINALSTQTTATVNSGLAEGLAAYEGLRKAAGLEASGLSAATLTYSDVKKIESQWDGLWGSASAYTRSSLITLKSQKASLESSRKQVENTKKTLENSAKTLEKSEESLIDAQKQIDDGWDSYNDSVKAFNKQRAEVLKTANSDELVSLSTLSTLIYAQNFEMPAGYIDDGSDNSWLIKIGENFDSAESMEDIVLTTIHDVGDVKLSDVAQITYIDNVGEEYAKMNGTNSVLLAVFKSSTASTNAVSDKVKEAITELEAKYKGLSVVPLLDQGDYIDMLVKSVLESMLLGAGLAIIILAIFLKDFVPTVVVAISIPLSVLLAIVGIYFTGLTLNIMTLAGLALGIGMLVDNSIVVIENIYRLRLLGNSAAKASVLGAKEVAAPIISSTLTTICVFLPIAFANGLVKDLITPMCLTVGYCLVASLLIALSVVPAAGSTLLKNSVPKEHKFFDKAMEKYGASLKWCLKHKAVPLLLAIALLGLSIWDVVSMGIVMIPDMATEPVQMTVTMSDDVTKEDAYKMVDEIAERVAGIDGVETVGAMPESALLSTVASTGAGSDYHNFVVYVMVEGENPTGKEIQSVIDQIKSFSNDYDCEIALSAAAFDMSALLGAGLSINIYGDDVNQLVAISEDIIKIVEKVDGYENISNAVEEGEDVVHLKIDKDAAMRCGLSVAQIYADINTRLTEEVKSTTLTVAGQEMDVKVRKTYSVPKVENLLDMTFNTKEVDADGDTVTRTHKLSEFATVEVEQGLAIITRENMSRYITVTADVKEGENATLLSRQLEPLLNEYEAPSGYQVALGGESDTVNNMVIQMAKLMALGFLFIYLVMVAQFQSLLSPFIILFTIPLGFTGGLLALALCNEQLSLMSIMGFMILMGTVVNNGIVFVDYANQLRISGMERHEALIETGKTRMRPILMTALTTILAMFKMSLGIDMAGQMGKGMALVIMGGLLYATLMTLYIVPLIYDILFKKKPLVVDIEV